MTKHRHTLESISFIIFFAIAFFSINAFNNEKLHILHLGEFIILKLVIYFILGVFLNLINKKINFKDIRFNFFNFIVALICILLVIFCFIFYAFMPSIIIKNLDIIELFLLAYAGANFSAAFLRS